MNILIIRLSALGDVAMTIPAIYDVACTYPKDSFRVVTTDLCAQLFVNAPSNVSVIVVRKPLKTRSLLKMVRKEQVDAVADLHNVARSWIVDGFFLLRGKRVAMLRKGRMERMRILQGHLKAQPFAERYYDVFHRLGRPCRPQFTSVYHSVPPLPDDISQKAKDERWIGIAPFARYYNKVYPARQMREVIEQLLQQSGIRLFLFGSKGHEAEMLASWAKGDARIVVVAGRYRLSAELSLMAHIDVMLTMDSANMHMASLVGTRVVSLWGSTTPACGFMGYGQKLADALCADLDCQPCSISGSRHCSKNTLICLRKINPVVIVNKVQHNIK